MVLGTVRKGRPHLIASLTKSAVESGLNAADIIREAAEAVGGRGGGRDTMAQAGGKDAAKLEEAIEDGSPGDRNPSYRRRPVARLEPRSGARLRQRPLRVRRSATRRARWRLHWA